MFQIDHSQICPPWNLLKCCISSEKKPRFFQKKLKVFWLGYKKITQILNKEKKSSAKLKGSGSKMQGGEKLLKLKGDHIQKNIVKILQEGG